MLTGASAASAYKPESDMGLGRNARLTHGTHRVDDLAIIQSSRNIQVDIRQPNAPCILPLYTLM